MPGVYLNGAVNHIRALYVGNTAGSEQRKGLEPKSCFLQCGCSQSLLQTVTCWCQGSVPPCSLEMMQELLWAFCSGPLVVLWFFVRLFLCFIWCVCSCLFCFVFSLSQRSSEDFRFWLIVIQWKDDTMLETASLYPVLDNAKNSKIEYLAISYTCKLVTNHSFACGWITCLIY